MESMYKNPFMEVFGSDLYTPIGHYLLTVSPNIIDKGWIVIIGIAQNGKIIGSAIVENVATKADAIVAHNFWIKNIIAHPPAILHDIKTNEYIIIEV